MPAPRKAGKEKWDAGNDTWTDRNGAVTEGMSVKGVLLRLLGEQYGINLPGSWARGTKGKPIFALPYGSEVWEVLTAMGGDGDEAVFLPQERDMAPDVRTSSGYAEIKTPRSLRKITGRLKHASEQLGAYGNRDGDVYLSLLRLKSEEQVAVGVAKRFVDDGTIKRLHIIHADGTIETLKKWTRASVLNQGARPFEAFYHIGAWRNGRRACLRSTWASPVRVRVPPPRPKR